MMLTSPPYLQTKRGELRGLNFLNLQNTNSEFVPNLIIKKSTREELDKILNAYQGNYDVKSLYQNISSLPLFSPSLSWGDEYILENSKKDIPGGSPEYWVSIAINHHIQWCLEENI